MTVDGLIERLQALPDRSMTVCLNSEFDEEELTDVQIFTWMNGTPYVLLKGEEE